MQRICEATPNKLRGGYYTPRPIAQFILNWALDQNEVYDILEPSCGDGIFLDCLKNSAFPYRSITAIEIEPEEAGKARAINVPNCNVITTEFHGFCNHSSQKFDLIVGNPPFIRYQFFDKQQQIEALNIFSKAGLKYSKLMNAWASFVVGSCLMLKDTGKLGFVIPAELLQVSNAEIIRRFICRFFNKITIISFKELVFSEIQQEVILLLCQKDNSNDSKIEHIEVANSDELSKLNLNQLRFPQKKINNDNKWTYYFLDQEEIDFIERMKSDSRLSRIGDKATVEVGITTGANSFFTVNKTIIDSWWLQNYAKPMIGRSTQISTAILRQNDWLDNYNADTRASLLLFPEMKDIVTDSGAFQYITQGDLTGISQGYKCRIRNEWQIIPSVWVSDALFLRRSGIYPKFLFNLAKVYTTDTMHRVNAKPGVDIKSVVASYYNIISLAFTEICGRSHGGGVLELMPSEVEKILIPYDEENGSLLFQIDELFRRGFDLPVVVRQMNEVLLKNRGFSERDINIATSIWKKMNSRRMDRGKTSFVDSSSDD